MRILLDTNILIYGFCLQISSHTPHYDFLIVFLALPRLAQAWLQYFLLLLYSRLTRNSFPQLGHTAIRVDFQFSGFGCLFFHANRQASEQNFFRLPLGFW